MVLWSDWVFYLTYFHIQAIQKFQYCQLHVLQENSIAASSVHLVHHINRLHSMKYSSICFRTGQKRCYLILLCMIIFTNQTCKSGEVDITALYVQQSPISWPQAVYGYMLAADCACMGLSVSLLSPLLSKWVLITSKFVHNLLNNQQYASKSSVPVFQIH